MQQPIKLTDDQLAIVFNAAQALTPVDRSLFLEAIAAELGKASEIGPGDLNRLIRQLPPKFFRPPEFTHGPNASKYG